MADAEIIPIGTRGRPGRGTGSPKPSASARSLAGTARPKPAAKKAAPKKARPTQQESRRPAPAGPEPVVPLPSDGAEDAPTRGTTSARSGRRRGPAPDAAASAQRGPAPDSADASGTDGTTGTDGAARDGRESKATGAAASAKTTGTRTTRRPAADRTAPGHTAGDDRTGPAAASDTGPEAGTGQGFGTDPEAGTAGSGTDRGTGTGPGAGPGTGWSTFVGSHHDAAADGIPAVDWMQAFTFAAREMFGDDWEDRLADFLAFLRRRATGDYTVDEYGFDREVTEKFFYAAIRPIAEKWFRVEVRGADNIPAEGGALVVSNHSGTIPVDGLVTGVTIFDHTGRHLRPLGADLVFRLPIVGELARKGGATLACNEDAERMLRGGELVGVWPEGFKGIGKPYADRYKLQRFGRGGFVSAALRTGVPIVPCSVVGAEEIYPLVGNLPSLARLLGVPYIPITPFFPALGLLGLIPLPSKWLIEFGEPIRTDSYEEGAADDPMLVFNVTDQVRETIQQTLYSLLMQRRSVFH